MYILFNSDDSIFIGCYSTLELAKTAYKNTIECIDEVRSGVPNCEIVLVPLDNTEGSSFFGGYFTICTWRINENGEWIKKE